MAYRIERTNGTVDGLGDAVANATEDEAWGNAENAFGSDPASDGPDGVRGWLRVVECEQCATCAAYGLLTPATTTARRVVRIPPTFKSKVNESKN